jgi:NADH-quinone oxidoreductase subunit N
MSELSIPLVLPVAVLTAWALLVLLIAPFFRETPRGVAGLISPWGVSLLGVGFAFAACMKQWTAITAAGETTAYGMVHVDRLGVFTGLLVLGIGFLTLLLSGRFLEREDAEHGEFYGLVLLALAGMIVMVQTTHLMVLLIGLEIFSVTFYVLCGLTRGRARSIEAALKYFLLGAFSSGFLVYGLAVIYGTTGSLFLSEVATAASAHPSTALHAGLGLLIVGLAFKIAVVPFHQWVPDVYTGAPTNVTALMAAATKAVAFAALLRVLVGAFGEAPGLWAPLITWLAIVTMTVANVIALAQTNIKRLLAFSSIAHAGYLLIAVVCLPEHGVTAILYYLTTYAFMTIGAFAVAAVVGRGDAHDERGYDYVRSWGGLGVRRPLLALVMTVFMLSLAGIPPTGGFIGKYLIFQAAVRSHEWLLAVVGSVNAAIAAYYYLSVLMTMWFKPAPDGGGVAFEPLPPSIAALLTFSAVAVVYLGVAPERLIEIARGLAYTLL